jgi:MoaA/NifB/PqqE/SkfB family radical SAM enzyme
VQVHPSLRCNLRCRHCYSSSGPEERDSLPVALLREALRDAAVEGYRALSVSGGEPLLYPDLEELLGCARGLGLLTTLTTNGMLLGGGRLERLGSLLDFVAISLDGTPPTHDRVRAMPRAFETMQARLPGLRDSGIPFGFLFTLRADNLEELPWAAHFAVEEGAKVLQIHPLTEAGRAASELPGLAPRETDAALAWLIAAQLQKTLGARLSLHVDLLEVSRLAGAAECCRAEAGEADREETQLADLVSPLVIEEDGLVVPLQHGFPRAHALGRLTDARLGHLAARWRRDRGRAFRQLFRRTLRELDRPDAPPFVDWYHEISRRAAQAA